LGASIRRPRTSPLDGAGVSAFAGVQLQPRALFRVSADTRRISITHALRDAPSCCSTKPRRISTPNQEMLVLQALAHRLSTIRSADTIDAVEDGKFLNIGRQDRRLASSPVYPRLFGLRK
jgi:hypothetical protein